MHSNLEVFLGLGQEVDPGRGGGRLGSPVERPYGLLGAPVLLGSVVSDAVLLILY